MLVHRRVTPSSKFAGTHLYTWVERGTMRVKCLAQEHNAVPRPGLEPGLFDPESTTLTIRPPCLPQKKNTIGNLFSKPIDPVLKDQTCGAIYSIPCQVCDKSYIGETKRKFSTRLKEHQKAVENKHSHKSALAEHC